MMVKKKENSHIQTLNFVDSYIFMSSKLSDFVDNVPGIYDKNAYFTGKKKLSQNVNWLVLKIIDYITNLKYVKKDAIN